MTQELTTFEGKQPIVMKSSLVHWVTKETADRIQAQLQNQTAHSFMRIREIDATINTAEVEGVYTMEQYDDLVKVKQGLMQCAYRRWHDRKERCDCAREIAKRHVENQRAEDRRRDYGPLTSEEIEDNKKKLAEMRSDLEARGVFPKKV